MINYKINKLANGLRIITAPMENTKAATILVIANVGNRFEEKSQSGISHFLEHMVFKGTKKRPDTLTISSELDSFGAEFNAFTSDEMTCFYVSAASSHLEQATDILLDMVFHSLLKEGEVVREKKVILEERKMYLDMSMQYVLDLARQGLYGDQPLGWSTLGSEESIKNIDSPKMKNYQQKFYTPKNLLVIVAGEIKDEKKILAKIETELGSLKQGEENQSLKVKENQIAPALKILTKKSDQQAHCLLSFRGLKRIDQRRRILRVMNNLFGGMMSSRLFIEVRERAGLGYYIKSDLWDFQDTGVLAIHFGVDKTRVEEAIKIILRECASLKEKLVDEKELKKSKDNLEGGLYLGLESSFEVAEFLAEQELFWKKIDQPEKIISENQKVTAEEIQKLAQEIFQPKNLNLAMISPLEDEEKFQKIFNQFN